jgi:hypothetical protein
MPRKHSEGLSGGDRHSMIQSTHQLATLLCQGASYLPPIIVDPLATDQPLPLEPVHQARDGWSSFHHPGGDFQRGQPFIIGVPKHAEYHVLLEGDPTLLGDGANPGARDMSRAPERLEQVRMINRHAISFV